MSRILELGFGEVIKQLLIVPCCLLGGMLLLSGCALMSGTRPERNECTILTHSTFSEETLLRLRPGDSLETVLFELGVHSLDYQVYPTDGPHHTIATPKPTADSIAPTFRTNIAVCAEVQTQALIESMLATNTCVLVFSDDKLERVELSRSVSAGGVSVALTGLASGCLQIQPLSAPSVRLHIFYYPWYGDLEHDGHLRHWQHPVLDIDGRPIPDLSHSNSIAASFYPVLGTYSSRDKETISEHMRLIYESGAGVVVVSWHGRRSYEARILPLILDAAEKRELKIAFQIEPVSERTVLWTRREMSFLIDQYGDHQAFYKPEGKNGMFYVYDSYLNPPEEWVSVLSPDGSSTIRGTTSDAVVIGLLVNEADRDAIISARFDGFYTYFASEGFTHGSTVENWPALAEWGTSNGLIFVPCVGPGYVDTQVRPWNGATVKLRDGGSYYDGMFEAAISSSPGLIAITSFNEWHEGTQIEPAAAQDSDSQFLDYEHQSPDYYILRTRYWASRWQYAWGTRVVHRSVRKE
jgi:glycoprotein endo-alpha-1,2-mannosidase